MANTTSKKKTTKTSSKTKNVAYAKSKKKSTKKKDIISEIYPIETTKLIATEDTSKQTENSCYLNSNNGVITALFSNTPIQNTNEKLNETVNEITTARPSFQVLFNKLEKQENVLELTSFDSKIKLQFDDKTPNKKKPAHRPLSIKSTNSVFWKNIDEKTNITFDVKSDRIEQNITVNKKAEKYSYSLILDTENLDTKILNDGQTLQLSDGIHNVYSISAPVLKNSEKKTFTAKTFNITQIKKNHVEISFEFDATLVNKEGRFPVTITPQIVNEDIAVLKYQHFSKATENASWKAGQVSSSAKFLNNNKLEKSVLTINKETFNNIQGKKISGVFAKIKSDSIKEFKIGDQFISIPSKGFGYLDITKDFHEANGKDITIELIPQHDDLRDPSSWREIRELPPSIEEAKIRHELEEILHNPPWKDKPSLDDIELIGDVVVEYFIDDELMPASESYTLAGGIEGNVTLDSGELTATFFDIAALQTSIPFKVSHTYKQCGDNFYCGKNWRLNLNQTLIKGSSINNGSDYIYTDENGYQHGFIETYYYYNDEGAKIIINKADVSIDTASGVMYYEVSSKKYEVFKDQRTSSGLKLNTKLEGFKNIEYYEQRQKEEKQLEDAIFSYRKNLSEYVIANKDTGVITKELKDSFSNGILTENNFNSFIGSISTGMLLQKQEAMQLESLYAQKEIYSNQILDNENQKKLYRNDSIELSKLSEAYQESQADIQYRILETSLQTLYKDWKDTDHSISEPLVRQLNDLYWQFKLLGKGLPYLFNYFYYNSKKNRITKDSKNNVQYSYNLYTNVNLQATQASVFYKQNNNTIKQEEDLNIQKSLIRNDYIYTQINQICNQIEYIKSRNDNRIEELKKVYQDYINYEYEFVKLQKTMAVASLSDGTKSLCFNKYGALCALVDSYNNYVIIEYDIYNRISNINDGKKSVIFKYNHYGLLSSITDFNGNRVEYSYSSTSNDALLKSVKLYNGDTISFTYISSNLIKVSSELERSNTKLTYTDSKKKFAQLESIINYSLVNKITDKTIESVSESIALKNNVFSTATFKYGIHECTITSDNKFKRYFMDDHGCLIGGYAQNDDLKEGGYSYTYVDRQNNESFSIHEIDDEIFEKNQDSSTIKGNIIPKTHKEFMFSGLITYGLKMGSLVPIGTISSSSSEGIISELQPIQGISSNNFERFEIRDFAENQFEGFINHHFISQTNPNSSSNAIVAKRNTIRTFIGLQATVTYSDNSTDTFEMPAINRTSGTQLCAVPISLNLRKEIKEIKLSFVNTTKQKAYCSKIRLAPAECKNEIFDSFKNIINTQSSTNFVCFPNDNSIYRYRATNTNYKYNEQHLLLEKRTTCTDSIRPAETSSSLRISTSSKILVTKYTYNDKGAQVREETYIEGDEATQGIMIDENVYDDKNRITKNKIYNSLDSTSKKYTEKEFSDNGDSVKAEFDALGVNKISYEYDPTTNNIATITYPSGSKFAYSRDCHTDAITGISQSTEDGESNAIETHYNCGLITKHTSGTNTIEYEYNAKREKTAVYFNGIKKVEYKHEKNVKLSDVTTEKTTATLLGNSQEGSLVTEAYIDSKKNLIQTSVNGKIHFKNRYSKTNDLIESLDVLTGVVTSTEYDEQNHRFNSILKSAGSPKFKFIDSVREQYGYDTFGKMTGHAIIVGENKDRPGKYIINHNYSYEYNSDSTRSLKSITLPNKLKYEPQKDFLGRNCGKTLLNGNGEKLFGEYISFRKVGDHTSDMVSSINYGELHNGKFSISEGVRYKYDNSGNIIERWEKGEFTSAYSYDHLNRLIREDNAILEKTWLFTYDKNGNRTTKTELPFTRQKTDEITDYSNAIVKKYSYDGDMLISSDNEAFQYNGFGNPIIFKNKKITWDNSKLTKFEDIEFDYDGYGKRIKKGSTVFIYDANNSLVLMKKDEKNLEFIYDDNGLSGITYQDKKYVVRKNAQGDITDIFTTNGDLVAHYEYDAWGNHKVLDGNENEITDPSHISNMNPFRYRGYFYDIETNLYYLINRYYDPETGRFISQDQFSYLQPEVVNGLNLFAYCGNNPVMRIDENGCSWSSFWKKIKKGFKAVGSFFKKVGMAIAGAVMAVVGFTIAIVAAAVSLTFCLIPGNVIGNAISGCLYQIGTSLCMYGGFMAAAAFSKDIYNDMANIGWNPFNTDAEKALNAKYVSFYKGAAVIKADLGGLNGGRSFYMGAIILDKSENDVNTIYHEWGHHLQLNVLGPANYFISVGIPSALWGSKDYYDMPWENIADAVGGANHNVPINNRKNAKQLALNSVLGPYSLIISAFL